MKEEGKAGCGGPALFEDPDFPCEDSALFSDSSTPLARLRGDITWLRPQEICQTPALFPSNINLGHAKQGLLGDCWFLCACTFLLKNKQLLNKVLPEDQPEWGDSRYRGSFYFRFWQQGHWTEVTVDDRLPCINSALCFSRCHSPTAFWVALVEKAYAKLHGSYERLWAGQVSEALVDLTGSLAERWSLGDFGSEEKQQTEQDSDQFRRRRLDLNLLNPVKDDCALSCSTHSTPGGLTELDQYHALTVMEWLDVKKVSGGEVRLLRIKNPWGRRYWGGAWVWSGAGWGSVAPDCASELQTRVAEGEFWLDEAEFMSQFDDVTVGYPISEEGYLKSIYTGNLLTHSHQLAGRWVKGHSAGGSRNCSSYSSNPKFWLKVCERGEVLVSLLQHQKWRKTVKYAQTPLVDSNTTKHQHYQAIALHLWKVEKKRFNLSRMLNKPPRTSTHCHAYEREVVLHGQLESGYYLLIPSTYQPGAEARFLIRVFSSSSISLSALKSPAPPLPLTADSEWETSIFRGSWVEGSTAGGSRNFLSHWQNPCFPFTVSDDPAVTSGVNVRITLHQSRADTDLLPIGFHIYKVLEGQSEETISRDEDPVASCVPHCYTLEASLACSLPPGAYAIVPSTYQPDCSANFTLSLARRIQRKVVKSQERLGKAVQEVSHISLMQS
ncbi:calpain-10 [Archocentrus centrarchus]|uniref:calpain-10 n=1 Tax=Archocentrus centrarchus TaxID=63155 RepID=UPI0011E9BEB3|nr:calpain-10 [Archocentrus centrarchus]XP_030608779.1 calpain-10 [Archocentrus centrarchus]XP_030608780.1 calpain-10 [Archocentrus centrarchus]